MELFPATITQDCIIWDTLNVPAASEIMLIIVYSKNAFYVIRLQVRAEFPY